MKSDTNLKKKLNLNVLDLLNNTETVSRLDFPKMYCNEIQEVNYIALYTEPGKYNYKTNTVVSFYNYDNKFDGMEGLFNSIYYNNEKLLDKYRTRFSNCSMFISPDYSQCGDVHLIENLYRLFKSRVVSIWLTIECNAIVIPNITYSSRDMFEYMLLGLEDVETVAFSAKGSVIKDVERENLVAAIKYTVDNLKKLKTIVVYSSCRNDNTVINIFKYAIDKGVKVIIPSNTLQLRNKEVLHGTI